MTRILTRATLLHFAVSAGAPRRGSRNAALRALGENALTYDATAEKVAVPNAAPKSGDANPVAPGSMIGEILARNGIPFVVVERDRVTVESIRAHGVRAIFGDAARPGLLEHAGIARARLLVVAAPEPYHARQIVERARRANPGVATVVRTHSAQERDYPERLGAGRVMMAEHELALSMAHYAVDAMVQDRGRDGAAGA